MKMGKFFRIFNLWICLLSVASAAADDTEILGAGSVTAKPNVMIIFDTSGSMAIRDIPETPYDMDADYSRGGGGYETNGLYRWNNDGDSGRWSKLVHWELLDPTCMRPGMADELKINGQAWIRINADAPYDCSERYDEIDLRTGNFLNYENGGYPGSMHKRLDVAKAVVKQLIDEHPNVRFGLMHFSADNDQPTQVPKGGKLTENGDINKQATADRLKADIDAFTADGPSPLAEALAEAGLYFAGQGSWFNHTHYSSPIDIKCRTNFIILMTDGDSTKDQDRRLWQKNAYIHNGTIGDHDNDGSDQHGSDYLDDVASFLYENDLMPEMGTGDPRFEKQHIIIHTIGFKKRDNLLMEAAENGGGTYFCAGSGGSLFRAFDKILNTVQSGLQVYATPSIPVSRSNGIFAGDHLYIALFNTGPNGGCWRGNIKKYGLNPFGVLVDKNSRPATDPEDMMLGSAQSYWSDVADGAVVDLGGAGALLVGNESRNMFTYTEGADTDLTADSNAFSITNKDNVSIAHLGVSNEQERQAVINDIHGIGKEWIMGDVLHSEPRVVQYDTNGDKIIDKKDDALIFVGTNGGVMHAFLDSSGQELWGFIPPHQLGRLKLLSKDIATHPYFLDGPPEVIRYENNLSAKTLLVFGERRGGSNYYALDITVHDRPIWKYCISDGIFGENGELLGQSWGRPQSATIASSSDSTVKVLLLPGGYDTNQDADEPKDIDGKGRAVFSVAADSGELSTFKFHHDGDGSDMTHSIVDLVGVDTNGDGITNSIYAPDLGGRMFAFTDDDQDGDWRRLKLFDASTDIHRKIFFSPDVVRIIGDPDPGDRLDTEMVGEMIFFGTGDRAHPTASKTKNRFYAVKNYYWNTGFDTLTDRMDSNGNGDLHDATHNPILQAVTIEAQQTAAEEIKMRMGWFIDLETKGEKVVSSPVVYNRTVYFTTYVPSGSNGDDSDTDCDAGTAVGEARLYGLDYQDARAVHSDWSDVKEYNPVSRKEIKSGGKADRYKIIGSSMPSAPLIAIRDGVVMLYVGVGGKVFTMAPKQSMEMNMYYWRQF